MNTEVLHVSSGFRRLYCEPGLFEPYSLLHPISFRRVLPFQASDKVMDDFNLLCAEEAQLKDQCNENRCKLIDAYRICGLLQPGEANHLCGVIDYYDASFYELMGLVYANAGMFKCALRWYRELVIELENRNPNMRSDSEGVYAGVGYCLYSLGLHDEAIAWSKSCIGPSAATDVACQALINYEAELAGGRIQSVSRSGSRVRCVVSATDPVKARKATPRLKAALEAIAPFQEFCVDWISQENADREMQQAAYPFNCELDGGNLPRHKMNLIFAACGKADALVENGYTPEAKRLLFEVVSIEPGVGFVWERIRALA